MYDVIVLGTGPVGQTVAQRVGAAGLSVAAVERELVGVSALLGMDPSKAMLRPVVAVADARRIAGARQAVTGPADAWRCSPAETGTSPAGTTRASWLKSTGAEPIRGTGGWMASAKSPCRLPAVRR